MNIPIEIKEDVRKLRRIIEGGGNFKSIEERYDTMDRLQNHISEVVLSILIKEDKERQDYFLNNR